MLPGQSVNVLDVPIQSKPKAYPSPSSSVDSLLVFTLDPKDKYLPQGTRRANSTSAIQSRKTSIATILNFKSGHRAPSDGKEPSTRAGQSSLERPRSLASVFDFIRQTRSAGSSNKSGLSWPRKIFSRSGSRAGDVAKVRPAEDVPPVPRLPSWVPDAPKESRDELDLPIQRPSSADSTAMAYSAPSNVLAESVIVPWPSEVPSYTIPVVPKPQGSQAAAHKEVNEDRSSETSLSTGYVTPLEQLKESNAFFAESGSGKLSREDLTSAFASQAGPTIGMRRGFGQQALYWEKRSSSEATKEPKIFEAQPVHPYTSYTESSPGSCAASDDDSPYHTSNTTQSGPMSPLHLSQAETPVMSDFDEEYPPLGHDLSSSLAQLTFSDLDQPMKPPAQAAPPPPPRSSPLSPADSQSANLVPGAGGFQGYSRPDADNASVLTLKKLPSMTFQPADAASTQYMVRSWDDGNPHHSSGLGKLMHELAYMGELINYE